jgi:hypothetical protein
VESTNGAIQVGVEHQKQGVLGRKVSIGDFLRVWKHGMHCNNENWFGNFFYLPYHSAPDNSEVHTVCNVQRHQCDLFSACIFYYKVWRCF